MGANYPNQLDQKEKHLKCAKIVENCVKSVHYWINLQTLQALHNDCNEYHLTQNKK
jgi:NAD-dependent dihydropyrimidine dehydrogenase PreA subunit